MKLFFCRLWHQLRKITCARSSLTLTQSWRRLTKRTTSSILKKRSVNLTSLKKCLRTFKIFWEVSRKVSKEEPLRLACYFILQSIVVPLNTYLKQGVRSFFVIKAHHTLYLIPIFVMLRNLKNQSQFIRFYGIHLKDNLSP